MDTYKDIPIIYNLFPRLAGTFDNWSEHTDRAAEMGFNWVFINSIHYPGLSGSLYSIKDYYRINPDFAPSYSTSDNLGSLEKTLQKIAECAKSHPGIFKYPSSIYFQEKCHYQSQATPQSFYFKGQLPYSTQKFLCWK